MKLFRIILIVLFIGICWYTIAAYNNYGWNLFAPFFSNLKEITWSGQFNLDFSSYLILSGLWIGWRNNFSPKGIMLCLLGMVLGIVFFAPYLIIVSYKENGDWKAILLGERNK